MVTPKTVLGCVSLLAMSLIGGILLGRQFSTSGAGASHPEVPALGAPCDFHTVASYGGGGALTDTRGLQCYLYGPASVSRAGIWIYPNRMSKPVFLPESLSPAFSAMTAGWVTFRSGDGFFTIRLPSQWHVHADPYNPHALTVIEGDDANVSIAFTVARGAAFAESADYAAIKDIPDDVMTYDPSEGDYVLVRQFSLNGSPATVVERMRSVDTGDDPYDVRLYVAAQDSYLQVAYSRYQAEAIDVPAETALSTIKLR